MIQPPSPQKKKILALKKNPFQCKHLICVCLFTWIFCGWIFLWDIFSEFLVANALRVGLLRRRDDAHGSASLWHGPLWRGVPCQPSSVRCDDRCRDVDKQDGTRPEEGLRSDAGAKMGDFNGKVRKMAHPKVTMLRFTIRCRSQDGWFQ